jgi:hypothetical protein
VIFAAVDPVTVVTQLDPVLGAIIAGLVSGCTVGVAIGIWVATLSARLRVIEERLNKGDNLFAKLDDVGQKAEIVSREMEAMGRMAGGFQTKELCKERHRLGEEIGEHAGSLVAALKQLSCSIDRAKGLGLAGKLE